MHLEGSRVDAALVGLAGFRVLAARQVGGGVELTVETAATVAGCGSCGVRAHSKGRKSVLVRDIDAFGRPVRLCWVKRRWRCPEPACPVATWTEQSAAIRPRRAMTERARVRACRRVGRDGESVAAVARSFAVGWHQIMGAVLEVGAPLRHKHRKPNWKQLRRRYLSGSRAWWPTDGTEELFDPNSVPVTRYRYRGQQIPTPWDGPAPKPA